MRPPSLSGSPRPYNLRSHPFVKHALLNAWPAYRLAAFADRRERWLHFLLVGDCLQVKIPAVDITQASVQTIDVGQAKIGPITVGELTVSNTDFTMSAAQIVMRHLSLWMTLTIVLKINVHIGLPIKDFDDTATIDLGQLRIPPNLPGLPQNQSIDISDVTVPSVTNIKLNVPMLQAQHVVVDADPLALQLGTAHATTIQAANLALPVSGFSIAGLTLTSASGSDITVPDAQVDSASIGHLTGVPIAIPDLGLNNLQLPTAQIPSGPGTPPKPGLSSSAPLDIPAQLSTFEFMAGRPHQDFVSVELDVTPFTQMHVEQLDIADATASATVGSIVLKNVVLPFDVLGLTLSQIGITSVQVPAFNVA
jgi:hypothetical protein